MPTSALRRILDLPVWQMCAPPPWATSGVAVIDASSGPDQLAYAVTATTAVHTYDPGADSWGALPSPALGTFVAGAATYWHPVGPTGTATAGTSTTITTATAVSADLTARNDLYFRIRITAGTGAGQERLIASATRVAGSVVTVTAAWTVTPDATSVYQLHTGRLWCFGGGTLAAASVKYYDYATGGWSASQSISGLPATFGTDARIVGTPSVRGPMDNAAKAFDTGTATAGGASTLTAAAETWPVNRWSNMQVRITAGLGAGQVRTVASNTATVLTTSAAWTVNPDATSAFAIEGNDDHLYLMGNAAVTLYRYSISGAAWTTLAPGAARAGAPTAGSDLIWAHGVTAADWSTKNGARLYSFRSTNVLDYYDLAANTWTSGVTTFRTSEPMVTTGGSSVYGGGDYVYIYGAATASALQRFFRLDLRSGTIEPFATNLYAAGATLALGTRLWITQYGDGTGTPIPFLYAPIPGLTANAGPLFRSLILT